MKLTSGITKKTRRPRVPSLPPGLRRYARDILTVQDARRIIRSHGGRPATEQEVQQLAAAGLAARPGE